MTRRVLVAHLSVCLTVVALTGAYLAPRIDVGWFAHDEGYLGHSAERVLEGELPHRDFDDLYTGGLALMHAVAFRLAGVDLIVLRWLLFGFSLLFAASLYAIAAHFVGPIGSGLVSLVAVALGPPLYAASMPTWYNLFLACFGTLALLRFLRSERRRWLILAGFCVGLSLVVKIVGLYFLAAVLLSFLFWEQTSSRDSSPGGQTTSAGFRVFQLSGLVLFCGLLMILVSENLRGDEGERYLIHFVLPGVALATFLLWNEATTHCSGSFSVRVRALARLAVPLALGLGLPMVAFVLPYAVSSSIPDLWQGVFVTPLERLEHAEPPPSWRPFPVALPIAGLLLAPLYWRRGRGLRALAAWLERHRLLAESSLGAGIAVGVFLILQRSSGLEAADRYWSSVALLVPITSVVGCSMLALASSQKAQDTFTLRASFLLLSVCAMGAMVQYPFSGRIYFGYVGPLIPLAVLAVASTRQRAPWRLYAMAAVASLALSVGLLHSWWGSGSDNRRLQIERASLRVLPRQAGTYEQVVAWVQAHSAPGSFIYATPDAPEVYFLTNRRNPTPTFFDFFEADYGDPAKRSARLLRLLEDREVDVVVALDRPQFSRRASRQFLSEIRARYPHRARNRRFQVFWRDGR